MPPKLQRTPSFRHRVHEIYTMYRPEDAHKVNVALKLRDEGTPEADILSALYRKMNVDAMEHKKNRLTSFYKKVAPDSMDKVEKAMTVSVGEEELMEMLHKKYNLPYPPPESSGADDAAGGSPMTPRGGAAPVATPAATPPPAAAPQGGGGGSQHNINDPARQARIRAFMEQHAPRAMSKLPKILATDMAEEALMEKLRSKYAKNAPASPGPASPGPASPKATPPPVASPPAPTATTSSGESDRDKRIREFFEQHAPHAMKKLPQVLAMPNSEEEIMVKLRKKYVKEGDDGGSAAKTHAAPAAAASSPSPQPTAAPPTPQTPQQQTLPVTPVSPPPQAAPVSAVPKEVSAAPPPMVPPPVAEADDDLVVLPAETKVPTPQPQAPPRPATPPPLVVQPVPAPASSAVALNAIHPADSPPLLADVHPQHVLQQHQQGPPSDKVIALMDDRVQEAETQASKYMAMVGDLHAEIDKLRKENQDLLRAKEQQEHATSFAKQQLESERSLSRHVQAREESLNNKEVALTAIEASIEAKTRSMQVLVVNAAQAAAGSSTPGINASSMMNASTTSAPALGGGDATTPYHRSASVSSATPGGGGNAGIAAFAERLRATEMASAALNTNRTDSLNRYHDHLVQIEAQLFEKCLQLQAHKEIAVAKERDLLELERSLKDREQRITHREKVQAEADQRTLVELTSKKQEVQGLLKQQETWETTLKSEGEEQRRKERELEERERAVAANLKEVEVRTKVNTTQTEMMEREREACKKLSNDVLKREATVRSVEKSMNIARAELNRLEQDVTARAKRLIEEEEAVKKWSVELGKKESNVNLMLQQLREKGQTVGASQLNK